MRVTTYMTTNEIQKIATDLGMEIAEHHESRRGALFVHVFKLRVNRSNTNYRSYNPITGRASGFHVPCWHGYRDFFEALFALDVNAHTVSGQMGMPKIEYRSKKEFDLAHAETQYMAMGSQMYPYHYIEKCNHYE